jgi:hypothetical protein
MEYESTWGGDPEDVCMTTRGVARVRELDLMWREAVADLRRVDGMRVLVDHTRLDWSQVNTDDIRERPS